MNALVLLVLDKFGLLPDLEIPTVNELFIQTQPAFLQKTAKGSDVSEYHLDEVNVRFSGDAALVRATGLWKSKAGVPGISRYVDVYARIGDDWRVVSAQITRPKM